LLVELVWVLSSAYRLTHSQLEQALGALLRTEELAADRADQVLRALRVFKATQADPAACLIERSADSAGCARSMTFDVGAAQAAGMTLTP
jgi:predicted nucleic-acid-binding protein